ncbi:unnamed protein product [Adineta ricciae]|uniref:SCP domain-containing protein n=1 Tax=Adineta ricciae TaxID=249248 RepID=A0A814XCU6_ADIRI|nr:unnamed protein product [Adineta ricciae]CAF1454235.1 unnamed protein product [Adineta ricciae]
MSLNSNLPKHCAAPLKLNATLNDIAQQYAERLASTNTFEHSGRRFNGEWMGENLYKSGGNKLLYESGGTPVTAWYDEIKDYKYDNPGFSKGIGRALTQDGTQLYVVANYFPGGNYNNLYVDNVGRPSC